MEDVLILRDGVWVIRTFFWVLLYFYYLSGLKPRFSGRTAEAGGVGILFFLSLAAQYGATITLVEDALLNCLAWFAAALVLKKTDWRNALYGALTFAVVVDLTKIISHDLVYSLLLEPLLAGMPSLAVNAFYSLVHVGIGLAGVFATRRLVFKSDKKLFSLPQMALVLTPALVYFYARNLQFVLLNSETAAAKSGYLVQVYILLLLLGFSDLLISLLADNNLSTRMQQQELLHMQRLIQKQRQEFISQKSASDAVNQKYHDLKNCLLGLRAEGMAESSERQRFVREIEQIMRPLESSPETGNDFLNIVLADKAKSCQERQIRLTPYADGRFVSFMDGLDVCVIVGNALDNAMEAVEKLPVPEREIHVKIFRSGGMLFFCFHNYFTGELKRAENGHLLTGKRQKEDHGYGMKGIAQIVEKYGGTMTVDAAGEEFNLNIMIPIPKDPA